MLMSRGTKNNRGIEKEQVSQQKSKREEQEKWKKRPYDSKIDGHIDCIIQDRECGLPTHVMELVPSGC